MRVFRGILLSTCMMLALTGSARAQALGQIIGVVADSSGAVLPGVTVTVAGTGLQRPDVVTTNPSGAYTFSKVPIGTYSVTFELSSFKKLVRKDIIVVTGVVVKIDAKMELGGMTEEVTITAPTPTVDTKKTTTGGTFTGDVLLNVPTARDPWQVLNMVPGVTLSGVNVGGSASGQQLTPSYAGTSANVQWNLEGGNITDMSSNSSPAYFNFDSFQEIQVVTGGGDVSIQSAGLFINLVTKSGSNVFKGSATETFENDAMQGQNVTQAMFDANTASGATLSGSPLHRIGNYSGEIGGPIIKNRLWFWGGTDYQDINAGVVNFYKPDTACQTLRNTAHTYGQLQALQDCLANDKTTIQDFNGKGNFQLNSANKFQFLWQTDYKLRNNRGASSSTSTEATQSQYSAGPAHFTNPTYQLTHTWLPSDKLVFTNQFTTLKGGFFLDNHDYTTCGSSTYARALAHTVPAYPAAGQEATATCQFNIQPLQNRTTGYRTRSIGGATYQTQRPSYELKTDGTYFLSHVAGGDHALKFGVGWRKNPVLTFTHTNGYANALMECAGNLQTGCPTGDNTSTNGGVSPYIAAGAAGPGLVPYRASLWRDGLGNYDWESTFAYLQDSYTKKRLTINGGLRYDYQWSVLLGGCVEPNPLNPTLLPEQCQGKADPKQPFHNASPRVSATYDVSGKGTTAVHSSFSYYFTSKQTLATSLSNTGGVGLTWGSNQNSGLCSTVANASCWTDANVDGYISTSELIGTPSASTSLFDTTTGILSTVAPLIDPNLLIGRTREAIVGFDHQVVSNVHVTFDYIYRYNDRGQSSYLLPASGNLDRAAAIAQIQAAQAQWVRNTWTDPQTGTVAPYYTCPVGTCNLPTGNTFRTNDAGYNTYNGIQIAINKRLSNKWQGNLSYTYNNNKDFNPIGSYGTSGSQPGNPNGIEFSNGISSSSPSWNIKAYGSLELPWGLLAGTNMQFQEGNVRNYSVTGPGTVASGRAGNPNSTVSYNTLSFEKIGLHHYPTIKLVDVNVRKTLKFGREELTLTLDCFNLFNINTIRGYSSSNISNNGVGGASNSFNQITSIVPPRVFRIDARFSF